MATARTDTECASGGTKPRYVKCKGAHISHEETIIHGHSCHTMFFRTMANSRALQLKLQYIKSKCASIYLYVKYKATVKPTYDPRCNDLSVMTTTFHYICIFQPSLLKLQSDIEHFEQHHIVTTLQNLCSEKKSTREVPKHGSMPIHFILTATKIRLPDERALRVDFRSHEKSHSLLTMHRVIVHAFKICLQHASRRGSTAAVASETITLVLSQRPRQRHSSFCAVLRVAPRTISEVMTAPLSFLQSSPCCSVCYSR